MKADDPLPLGLRLRRARREAGLSQAELARRAGVSQPLVSYYERSTGEPDGEGLESIAKVLGVPIEAGGRMVEATVSAIAQAAKVSARGSRVERVPPAVPLIGAPMRAALLASLDRCELEIALLDRPAPDSGGDVALAVQLRNHVLVAVLDGTGAGPAAGMSALLQAASMLGALGSAQGLIWPDELLEALADLPRSFGLTSLAASFVLLMDLRHAELAWASSRFPTALLRNKQRVTPLRGERRENLEHGRMSLEPDWMLLVATDGVAHAMSRGAKPLFETREVQQLLKGAHHPQELIDRLGERVPSSHGGPPEDGLALAITAR